MAFSEEVLIDGEVRDALDRRLLAWANVTSGEMCGGVSYLVGGRPFAVLLEGVVAMGLPQDLRARALALAGVSPFRPPADEDSFQRWVQFVLVLAEDVPAVVPWLEAASRHAASPA